MAERFKRLQDLAGLPRAVPPGELWRLTGAVDPVGDIQTGLGQAAENAGEKAKGAILDLKTIGALFAKRGLGFLIPDAAKDEMEKEKQRKTKFDSIIQAWK